MINQLFRLATFLEKNKFFQSLTEQIVVDENREIEIIPSLGNFVILLGDANNLEEKFNKLDEFYHKVFGNVKDYKQLDLRFDKLIYAQQRNYIPPKIILPPTEIISDSTAVKKRFNNN